MNTEIAVLSGLTRTIKSKLEEELSGTYKVIRKIQEGDNPKIA